MKVEMLNVGWITAPAGVFREGEPLDQPLRFPVPAFLIETDSERILIDTGLQPAAIEDPAAYYERPDIATLFKLEQEQSIADQLDLATLTKVVLTHLHWDHVGGLGLVPESVPIVIQRAEWQAGHDEDLMARNFFFPRDYGGDGREVILVDGDHDLLGDGSVELLVAGDDQAAARLLDIIRRGPPYADVAAIEPIGTSGDTQSVPASQLPHPFAVVHE